MTCFHPVTAWRARTKNESGKRSLVFTADKGLMASELKIPCGNCIGCRVDRSQAWSLRLVHELKDHPVSSYLTLTYDPLYVPENGSLVPRHLQQFMKDIRKYYAKFDVKLRFFACGEYGDQLQRPHYHLILFGADFADRRKHSTTAQGHTLWKSETLTRIWGKGHCTIGTVTADSCAYVARYIVKKINGEMAEDHYTRVNPETGEIIRLEPEFVRMSRRPGIGSNYYEKFHSDLYPSDFAIAKGRKNPVPKYYDKKLEEDNLKLFKRLKQRRKKRAKENADNNTPERLAVRKEVFKSKIKQLTRPIE